MNGASLCTIYLLERVQFIADILLEYSRESFVMTPKELLLSLYRMCQSSLNAVDSIKGSRIYHNTENIVWMLEQSKNN